MNRRLAPIAVLVTVAFLVASIAIYWPSPSNSIDAPWTLATVAFAACGALIITRRPTHPIGWLFSAYGLLSGAGYVLYALAERVLTGTAAGWADAVGSALATVSVIMIPASLLRFPDGLLPSRRWTWVSILVVVAAAAGAGASLLNGGWGGDVNQAIAVSPLRAATSPVGDVLSNVFLLLMLTTMATASVSLIVRYRQTRGTARDQMKWLALAALYLVLCLVIAFLVDGALVLAETWLVWLVASAFASVPIAVAVAILRHRLYDIDRIINRTIVYGMATGTVLAVYVATVFAVSTVAAGRSSNLTVALATLASATAFRPALRRVQQFVDRRFYRRRFNVQSTIEGFGSRLSHDPNLEHLTDDLLGVVRSTMQPDRVDVWLRQAEASG